ncbi:MAG: hypothetical protein QXQ53_04450 [Candidatus Methanosuratincola sp.]
MGSGEHFIKIGNYYWNVKSITRIKKMGPSMEIFTRTDSHIYNHPNMTKYALDRLQHAASAEGFNFITIPYSDVSEVYINPLCVVSIHYQKSYLTFRLTDSEYLCAMENSEKAKEQYFLYLAKLSKYIKFVVITPQMCVSLAQIDYVEKLDGKVLMYHNGILICSTFVDDPSEDQLTLACIAQLYGASLLTDILRRW